MTEAVGSSAKYRYHSASLPELPPRTCTSLRDVFVYITNICLTYHHHHYHYYHRHYYQYHYYHSHHHYRLLLRFATAAVKGRATRARERVTRDSAPPPPRVRAAAGQSLRTSLWSQLDKGAAVLDGISAGVSTQNRTAVCRRAACVPVLLVRE